MKRVAAIRLSRELVESFFGTGAVHQRVEFESGLPPGAVLCGVELTGEHLILSFSHPDFEASKEGEKCPEIIPVFKF